MIMHCFQCMSCSSGVVTRGKGNEMVDPPFTSLTVYYSVPHRVLIMQSSVPTPATARPPGDAIYPAATWGALTTGRPRFQGPPQERTCGPVGVKAQGPGLMGGAVLGTNVRLSTTRPINCKIKDR